MLFWLEREEVRTRKRATISVKILPYHLASYKNEGHSYRINGGSRGSFLLCCGEARLDES